MLESNVRIPVCFRTKRRHSLRIVDGENCCGKTLRKASIVLMPSACRKSHGSRADTHAGSGYRPVCKKDRAGVSDRYGWNKTLLPTGKIEKTSLCRFAELRLHPNKWNTIGK